MSFFTRNVAASFTGLAEGRGANNTTASAAATNGHDATRGGGGAGNEDEPAGGPVRALPARRSVVTVHCRRDAAALQQGVVSATSSVQGTSDVVHRLIDLRRAPQDVADEIVKRIRRTVDECAGAAFGADAVERVCAGLADDAAADGGFADPAHAGGADDAGLAGLAEMHRRLSTAIAAKIAKATEDDDTGFYTDMMQSAALMSASASGGGAAASSSSSSADMAGRTLAGVLLRTLPASFDAPSIFVCECDPPLLPPSSVTEADSAADDDDDCPEYSPASAPDPIVAVDTSNLIVRMTGAFHASGNAADFVRDVVALHADAPPRQVQHPAAIAGPSRRKEQLERQQHQRSVARLEQFVAVLLAKVLVTLARAHDLGIVHGALAASNVFVTRHITTPTVAGSRGAFEEASPATSAAAATRISSSTNNTHNSGVGVHPGLASGADVWPLEVALHDAATHRHMLVSSQDGEPTPDMTPFVLRASPHPRVAAELDSLDATARPGTSVGNRVAAEHQAAATAAVLDVLPAVGLDLLRPASSSSAAAGQQGQPLGRGVVEQVAGAAETPVGLLGLQPPSVESRYVVPATPEVMTAGARARGDVHAIGQLAVELLRGVPAPPFADPEKGVALLRLPGDAWSVEAMRFVATACDPAHETTCLELLSHPFITRNLAKFAAATHASPEVHQTLIAAASDHHHYHQHQQQQQQQQHSPNATTSASALSMRPQQQMGSSSSASVVAGAAQTSPTAGGILKSSLRTAVGVSFDHRGVLHKVAAEQQQQMLRDRAGTPEIAIVSSGRPGYTLAINDDPVSSAAATPSQSTHVTPQRNAASRKAKFRDPTLNNSTGAGDPAGASPDRNLSFASHASVGTALTSNNGLLSDRMSALGGDAAKLSSESSLSAGVAVLYPALQSLMEATDPCAASIALPQSSDGTVRARASSSAVLSADPRAMQALVDLGETLALADTAVEGYTDQWLLSMLYAAVELPTLAASSSTAHGGGGGGGQPGDDATGTAAPPPPRQPAADEAVAKERRDAADALAALKNQSKAVLQRATRATATALLPAQVADQIGIPFSPQSGIIPVPVLDPSILLTAHQQHNHHQGDSNATGTASASAGRPTAGGRGSQNLQPMHEPPPPAECTAVDLANFIYAKWATVASSNDTGSVLRCVELASGATTGAGTSGGGYGSGSHQQHHFGSFDAGHGGSVPGGASPHRRFGSAIHSRGGSFRVEHSAFSSPVTYAIVPPSTSSNVA